MSAAISLMHAVFFFAFTSYLNVHTKLNRRGGSVTCQHGLLMAVV